MVKVDSVKMMKHITLYVRPTREIEAKWRLWLGVKLLMLGAWIMNCSITIEGRVK